MISVAVSHYAQHRPGSTLNKMFLGSEKFFTKVAKPLTKEYEKHGKAFNEIVFLGSGGWLLLFPMKWIEDGRNKAIKSLDNLLGTAPKSPEALEAYNKKLEDQPRQTYVSLLGGRALTFTTTCLTGHFVIQNSQGLVNYLERTVGKLAPGTLKEHPMPGGRPYKLSNGIAQEVILAGTSAALLYASSKAIAWWQHQHRSHDVTPQTPESGAVDQVEYQQPVQTHAPARGAA